MPSLPGTFHRVIIGDSREMKEIKDKEIHLVITSPPYYNAPFDYKGYFTKYSQFLSLMKDVAKEIKRVLQDGRIVCINCDDMLVDGEKFPIVADVTKIFMAEGFAYRDALIWKKPEGYIRKSRRSGVIIQHPYPMYYYPDNLTETILIFQKGDFDYQSIDSQVRKFSRIDIPGDFLREKWYLNVWEITNVLPLDRIEKDVAAFPDELPYRLIQLFSFVGETILDPFLGSGTTIKVAKELGRNSVGYEIDERLIRVIESKVAQRLRKKQTKLLEANFIFREISEPPPYELKITRRERVTTLVPK